MRWISHTVIRMRVAWQILNDGKDILFRSERTGWGHYYHYDGQMGT